MECKKQTKEAAHKQGGSVERIVMRDLASLKIKIQYETKETQSVKPGWHRHIIAEAELTPIRIFRRTCGSGAAANRYYYLAKFIAPADAYFVIDGLIEENINRKRNPHFNPKKLKWVGNNCRA